MKIIDLIQATKKTEYELTIIRFNAKKAMYKKALELQKQKIVLQEG